MCVYYRHGPSDRGGRGQVCCPAATDAPLPTPPRARARDPCPGRHKIKENKRQEKLEKGMVEL